MEFFFFLKCYKNEGRFSVFPHSFNQLQLRARILVRLPTHKLELTQLLCNIRHTISFCLVSKIRQPLLSFMCAIQLTQRTKKQ